MKNRYSCFAIAASTALLTLLASIPTTAQLSNSEKLALDGIGQIRVGMTIAEAERAAGIKLVEPDRFRANESCYYVERQTGPRQVGFMVFSGSGSKTMDRNYDRITRIDVDPESSVTTLSGAGIGTTEAQIQAMYPGKIKVTPHPYNGRNGGKYLTYMPRYAADQRYSLIFETDKGKVVRFRSGFADAVSQIEGCV